MALGKRCTMCKKWKLYREYYADKRNKDGLQARCKKCHAVESREWEESNPEYYREQVAARTARRDPETHRAQVRNAYQSDLEKARLKVKIQDAKRRAWKIGSGGTITETEWLDLKEKYNYTCLRCKRKEPKIKLTLDHVKPLKLGGENRIENAQPLCLSCNCSKGARWIDYR